MSGEVEPKKKKDKTDAAKKKAKSKVVVPSETSASGRNLSRDAKDTGGRKRQLSSDGSGEKSKSASAPGNGESVPTGNGGSSSKKSKKSDKGSSHKTVFQPEPVVLPPGARTEQSLAGRGRSNVPMHLTKQNPRLQEMTRVPEKKRPKSPARSFNSPRPPCATRKSSGDGKSQDGYQSKRRGSDSSAQSGQKWWNSGAQSQSRWNGYSNPWTGYRHHGSSSSYHDQGQGSGTSSSWSSSWKSGNDGRLPPNAGRKDDSWSGWRGHQR